METKIRRMIMIGYFAIIGLLGIALAGKGSIATNMILEFLTK